MSDQFEDSIPDLYDWEEAAIQHDVMPKLAKFMRMANTRENLEEFKKIAQDEFLKIGLIVEVNIAKALFNIGPPDIEVVKRIPGHADNKYGHDHEFHKTEVLKGNALGEKFLGERDGAKSSRRRKMS